MTNKYDGTNGNGYQPFPGGCLTDPVDAAAPDLLEALAGIADRLELGDHEGEMYAKAIAAIAKARG
jgi:hypothetical protein